jgi:peptide deformylase
MVLPIKRYPAPILKIKCKPVAEIDDSIRQLCHNMIETMREADGVGLAAPQIGIDLQIAVIDVGNDITHNEVTHFLINGNPADLTQDQPLIIINPIIELKPHKISSEEGCLSIPGLRANVRRSEIIKVTFKNLNNDTITVEANGLLSRCFQHELDHLNGILFIDRVSTVGKLAVTRKLKSLMEEWD